MSEIIPDNSNQLAHALGLAFHPAVLAIPALLLLLRDLPLSQALFWTMLMAGIILIPGFSLVAYLRQRHQHVYQRQTRKPVYALGWLSVLLCLVLIWRLDGPRELALCIGMLALWLPLQMAINHYVTKISVHTAVASGCFTALLLLGKLNPWLILMGLSIIVLVTWARLVTKNHSPSQLALGLLLGTASALVVYFLLT